MTLLHEIQAAASDDSTSLSSVLRRCQILAARLRYQPLKLWVEMESNGYQPRAELPTYRIMRGVASKADFAGPLGRLSNYPIPGNFVPDIELQALMATMTMRDGIAVYEAMLEELGRTVGGGIKNPWPPGVIDGLRLEMNGMRCIEAWQELPASSIAGMLSQIRNRVLAFTLEIEEANPDLGESLSPPSAPEQEKVATSYQTVILGGNQTIVHGGVVEQHIAVFPGDLVGLIVKLKELGVPMGEISELTRAIDEDQAAGKTLGHKTERWLVQATKKVGSGAWKLAAAAAPDVLSAIVKSYFDIH